jgi:hypothetical protein
VRKEGASRHLKQLRNEKVTREFRTLQPQSLMRNERHVLRSNRLRTYSREYPLSWKGNRLASATGNTTCPLQPAAWVLLTNIPYSLTLLSKATTPGYTFIFLITIFLVNKQITGISGGAIEASELVSLGIPRANPGQGAFDQVFGRLERANSFLVTFLATGSLLLFCDL